MRIQKVDNNIQQEIIHYYNNEFLTITAISKKYDSISCKVITRILRNNGIEIDSNRGNGNIDSIKSKDEIVICKMYNTGLYSIRDLSKEYNVCGQSIKKILRKNYIDINNNRKRHHGICETYIIDDYKFGYSMNGLSKKYNIADKTIKRLLVNQGIDIKKIYTVSSGELEVVDYIKSIYDGEIILNSRNIIKPLELDIYIPEHNLAIEYHGDYFHSELFKDNNYHKVKYDKCKEKNITLIQLFESEWRLKADIIKRIIKNKLNLRDLIIYARKCSVVFDYDKNVISDFFNKYHIQGKSGHSISTSLIYNNDVVASMLFIRRKCGYELVRYCSKGSVVGGFSRCIKNAIKRYDISNIYSFADNRFVNENNNVYVLNNFEKISRIAPDYKYYYKNALCHKFGFRHKSLKNKLRTYDPEISEHQNCLNNDVYQVYDAGKIKYLYKF